MENSQLVSIVVPAFNAEKTLEASIYSLIEQSLRKIEIVIINDASDDKTLDIANRLAKIDSRVKVIDLPFNQGVYKARAVGIEAATGSWIGFLDADDFVKPTMYERMLEVGEAYSVDIVICNADRVTQAREFLNHKVSLNKEGVQKKDIFKSYCHLELGTGALWNKLYKASNIKKWGTIKHPIRQDTHEDAVINFGCFYEAESIYLLKSSLYEYVYNSASVTSKIKNDRAFYKLILSYFLALSIYKDFDKDSIILLTDLYRLKLEWSLYQPLSLNLSEQDLQLLTPLMAHGLESNPEAILKLLLRQPTQKKRSLVSWVKKWVAK